MIKRFIGLQWKAFFRSSSFGKSLALKILMIFFTLYLLATLVGVGVGLYYILREVFPDQNPMWMLSRYLVYWVLVELLFRYFMQKIPVMDVKPLLSMPIKKSSIAHYILGRSTVSWYNILALFPLCSLRNCTGIPRISHCKCIALDCFRFCHCNLH